MIKIELTKEDTHDFTIKEENNRKRVIFKRDDIGIQRCYKLVSSNTPDPLKDVYVIDAPNPFAHGFDGKYIDIGWNFPNALLAFKKGLIDGFVISRGGLFRMVFEISVDGIIVIDSDERIKVREYFETEFKELLDNINEDDFNYIVEVSDWRATTKLLKCVNCGGISNTYEGNLKKLKEDDDNRYSENEIKYIKENGIDKFNDNLAHLLCYTVGAEYYGVSGIGNRYEPLEFKTIEETEKFIEDYKSWNIYEQFKDESSRQKYSISIDSYKFNKWFDDKVKRGVE